MAHFPPPSCGATRPASSLWSVNQILDKKTENDSGETSYKVHWNTTTLDRKDVSLRDDGTSYAVIDDQEFEIEDLRPRSGGIVEVHWEDSWHQRVDLSGTAEELVADFEAGVHSPESTQGLIAAALPFCSFTPESSSHDYTDSFVEQLTAELRSCPNRWNSLGKVPIWAAYLAHPTRNRLVFRRRFIAKRNIINMSIESSRQEHRRILSVHRTGDAVLRPCEHCKDGEGPWRRCVVDRYGLALNSACTNCSISGRMAKCSFSRRNRVDCLPKAEKEPSMKSGLDRDEADALVLKKRKVNPAAKRSSPSRPLLRDNAASNTAISEERERIAKSSPSDLPSWSGAWDDTYVSNSIGGTAEWSSPIAASRRAECVNEESVKQERQRSANAGFMGTPLAKRPDRPAENESPMPVCSPCRSSPPPGTAEYSRRKLMAQFCASPSPASQRLLRSSPQVQSQACPSTPAAVQIKVRDSTNPSGMNVHVLLGRCKPQHKALLEAAWTTWVAERAREQKAQPFSCAEHFFEVVWYSELIGFAAGNDMMKQIQKIYP